MTNDRTLPALFSFLGEFFLGVYDLIRDSDGYGNSELFVNSDVSGLSHVPPGGSASASSREEVQGGYLGSGPVAPDPQQSPGGEMSQTTTMNLGTNKYQMDFKI